jgi:hypothetical protein
MTRLGWDGAGAPGGASPRPEPGAGSAGRGAAQLVVAGVLVPDRSDNGKPDSIRLQGSPGGRPAYPPTAPGRGVPGDRLGCGGRAARVKLPDLVRQPALELKIRADRRSASRSRRHSRASASARHCFSASCSAASSNRMPCRSYRPRDRLKRTTTAASVLCVRARLGNTALPAGRKTR